MPHDRTLSRSPFPGDVGDASPEVRGLLAAAADGSAPSYLRAVAALCGARLLVPVVATATRQGATAGGLVSEKEAEMAVVLLQTPDGQRAVLAFSGLASLRAWRPDARPVPATLDAIAQTAMAEGAAGVLVDSAGPHRLVIEEDLLSALAQGRRLVELSDGGFGWASAVSPP